MVNIIWYKEYGTTDLEYLLLCRLGKAGLAMFFMFLVFTIRKTSARLALRSTKYLLVFTYKKINNLNYL